MQLDTTISQGKTIEDFIKDFPGWNASHDLYEDDGESLDYQKGIFAITHIASNMEIIMQPTINKIVG